MPDWITNIGISGAGLPWPAALCLLLFFGIAREVVPASLKLMGFNFEREKYKDQLERQEHNDLVDELRRRIEQFAAELAEVKREAREDRIKAALLLAEEKAAHAKCQIDKQELRGDLRVHSERMNTMQVQLDSLTSHKKNNIDHLKGIDAAIVKIDPSAAADLLPKP